MPALGPARPASGLADPEDSRPISSSRVRVALIDDDSGLVTVLDRRFEALRWDRELLHYAAPPEQLAALRLHALVVNPALTGLDYIEQVAHALPGLALLVCSETAPAAERVRALRGGELAIRPDRFDAYVGNEAASLSRKEYELLYQLAAADGRVLEREEIYQRVWGYTMVRGDRSVDVFVRKLRGKLERVSPSWGYVHTHFGVGYRFAAEPAVDPAGTTAGPDFPALVTLR